MKIQPYIVVPNLIEQPTWGGTYIARYKDVRNQKILSKNIGQSYELYEHSNLWSVPSTVNEPALELGDPFKPEQSEKLLMHGAMFSIQELIRLDPAAVLGRNYLQKFGPQMKTLIKFTQAKGNSYQIHVKSPAKHWLPKPESWYFFEPAVITLGVKEGIDWAAYERVCRAIHQVAEELSVQIHNNELSVLRAREQLNEYIAKNNPVEFVNLVKVDRNQAIDLSGCGLHHSWEEDTSFAPEGNVLYEVQENVFDDVSTIRCFDKGKMKDDGTIRDLHLNDYFAYIDRSADTNNPKSHTIDVAPIGQTDSSSISQIFKTPGYALQAIQFTEQFTDQTADRFHHLFVKEGTIELQTQTAKLVITKGFSVFLPASTGTYQLISSSPATVLKTYLE